MDFSFDESQTAVRELARRVFAAREVTWRELGGAGLFGVALPVEVGGADAGLVALCCVLEQAGEAASALPLIPSLVLAGLPLARAGVAAELLAGLSRGERTPCGVFGTRGEPALSARRYEGGWLLSGVETCVEGLPLADALLVAARVESGAPELFLLDPAAAGVAIEPQSVASGIALGSLRLQDAAAESVGCEPSAAAGLVEWTLERAYLVRCAYELGLSARALALTARFATERQQFGRPIGTFQAVAQRVADAHIAVETMRLTLWRAAWLLDQGAEARREVAVARAVATQAAHEVVSAAQHIHGSLGFDREYPLYRYYLAAKQSEVSLGGYGHHLARLGKLLAES